MLKHGLGGAVGRERGLVNGKVNTEFGNNKVRMENSKRDVETMKTKLTKQLNRSLNGFVEH